MVFFFCEKNHGDNFHIFIKTKFKKKFHFIKAPFICLQLLIYICNKSNIPLVTSITATFLKKQTLKIVYCNTLKLENNSIFFIYL